MTDEKGDDGMVMFADGRKAPASLVTKPLVEPGAKPAPEWKKCSDLPDCAEKNPEIIAGLTAAQDAAEARSKVTTEFDDLDERLADLAMPTCLD
jgi:hypothetical protein